MKLNNEQKVLLCQKALYAKQLAHYARLCRAYQSLAQVLKKEIMPNASPEVIADKVQQYYGPYLSKAAQGNLSFLNSKDGPIFNRYEMKAFENFSDASLKIDYFKTAAELLREATYSKDKNGNSTFYIDDSKMAKYHTFLNPPESLILPEQASFFKEGRSFDQTIAESPKRWIGHTFFKKADNALKIINEIDSNHISSLNTKNISLTPKSFGATITGARGNISREKTFTSPKQEFEREVKNSFDSKDKKPISALEDVASAMYVVGYHAKEKVKSVYRAHKGTLKKA